MGRVFVVELEGRAYRCKFCKTQLALAKDLASRGFHCSRGKAYLFENAVNITVGASEERMMLSGNMSLLRSSAAAVARLLAGNMNQLMRKAKSTKRASLFLKDGGLLMEPTQSSTLIPAPRVTPRMLDKPA